MYLEYQQISVADIWVNTLNIIEHLLQVLCQYINYILVCNFVIHELLLNSICVIYTAWHPRVC